MHKYQTPFSSFMVKIGLFGNIKETFFAFSKYLWPIKCEVKPMEKKTILMFLHYYKNNFDQSKNIVL
jgi:hypothetical protein